LHYFGWICFWLMCVEKERKGKKEIKKKPKVPNPPQTLSSLFLFGLIQPLLSLFFFKDRSHSRPLGPNLQHPAQTISRPNCTTPHPPLARQVGPTVKSRPQPPAAPIPPPRRLHPTASASPARSLSRAASSPPRARIPSTGTHSPRAASPLPFPEPPPHRAPSFMAAVGVPAPHRLCRPSLFPLYTIKHELGLLSISHRSSSPPPRLHNAAPKLHRRRSPLAANPFLRRLSLPSELPGESPLLSSSIWCFPVAIGARDARFGRSPAIHR
jgi:hypothetical protein